ncbi:hypothetical protein ACI0FM_01460 [Paenochrobactrum sp. BZR 588]
MAVKSCRNDYEEKYVSGLHRPADKKTCLNNADHGSSAVDAKSTHSTA